MNVIQTFYNWLINREPEKPRADYSLHVFNAKDQLLVVCPLAVTHSEADVPAITLSSAPAGVVSRTGWAAFAVLKRNGKPTVLADTKGMFNVDSFGTGDTVEIQRLRVTFDPAVVRAER